MKYVFNYIWAIVWATIMLILMGMPSNNVPSVGLFEGFDKLAHCGSFFLLTVFLLQGFTTQSNTAISKVKNFFYTLLITSFFAFATELLQYYLDTGRQADWWDIFADFVGIGMALFSYLIFFRNK
ncbi:VanZ family protein [Sphingobacterium sp. UT-1RO-CII-1]|uniref:VanZ family protein n=1 Tax=Sphingobacterium sp. UT-1RO-CII-1 TaxID=2995225 RepID=UPI00227CE186|nr:VanZ family protein [Sphingobacterium sp. UT-1RO-CII-1]MCY4778632.1 VanZ family protein [Sphingobacterium sp. UT-1RO-CII-1]